MGRTSTILRTSTSRPSRLRALTRMTSSKLELLRERFDEREELIFAHQVDFGEDEEDGAVELADERKKEFVF